MIEEIRELKADRAGGYWVRFVSERMGAGVADKWFQVAAGNIIEAQGMSEDVMVQQALDIAAQALQNEPTRDRINEVNKSRHEFLERKKVIERLVAQQMGNSKTTRSLLAPLGEANDRFAMWLGQAEQLPTAEAIEEMERAAAGMNPSPRQKAPGLEEEGF